MRTWSPVVAIGVVSILSLVVIGYDLNKKYVSSAPDNPFDSPQEIDRVLMHYYETKPVGLVSSWISFCDEAGIEAPTHAASFFAELFRRHPEKLEEWIVEIDSLSNDSMTAMLYLALWLSNAPSAQEYLDGKVSEMTGEQGAQWGEMISSEPPALRHVVPDTPTANDMQWGALFATGDPHYVVNIVDAACRYDEREDLMIFMTAASAKWSLASLAQTHETVIKTLKREYTKRKNR